MKYQETYADALLIESFFTVNLGRGPVTSTLVPPSLASIALELLAGADFYG